MFVSSEGLGIVQLGAMPCYKSNGTHARDSPGLESMVQSWPEKGRVGYWRMHRECTRTHPWIRDERTPQSPWSLKKYKWSVFGSFFLVLGWVCPFPCLSVSLSVCLSVCLSICQRKKKRERDRETHTNRQTDKTQSQTIPKPNIYDFFPTARAAFIGKTIWFSFRRLNVSNLI